jgi:hypothetical protein
MQSYYVGLDVHSRESVFVVENDAGQSVRAGVSTDDGGGAETSARQLLPSDRNWYRTRDSVFDEVTCCP